MNREKNVKRRGYWGLLYAGVFIAAFLLSAIFKLTYRPFAQEFAFDWNNSVGRKYADLPYGEKKANRFDLYVPSDATKKSYGLVVYLHAGGFTTGDKSDDESTLRRFCSLGYVAAGINYTLCDAENPDANVYTQSLEIKESIPFILAEAEKRGFRVDKMAIGGGSAGGCLALLYAYRDAKTSPVPVAMVFEAVGPSSFYPEDWDIYGLDKNRDAAAALFSVLSGKKIDADAFGTPAYDDAIKDVSPLLWIDENAPPTLCAYGVYDKLQPFKASKRLAETLKRCNIPHDYIVFKHSGHGLQNDDAQFVEYMRKTDEYLKKYMPVK